jgi:hypothetical protein
MKKLMLAAAFTLALPVVSISAAQACPCSGKSQAKAGSTCGYKKNKGKTSQVKADKSKKSQKKKKQTQI